MVSYLLSIVFTICFLVLIPIRNELMFIIISIQVVRVILTLRGCGMFMFDVFFKLFFCPVLSGLIYVMFSFDRLISMMWSMVMDNRSVQCPMSYNKIGGL